MFRDLTHATSILIALLAVASCNSNSESESTSPAHSIGIAVSTAELSIMCGSSGTATATLTRGGGFSGTVMVTMSGLPAGVSAILSPSELTGSEMSTTVTIMADTTAPPGKYTVTVRATSSIGQTTATYQLVIVRHPAEFRIAVDPAVMTIARTASRTATVQVARTGGFTGVVTLSVEGASNGIIVGFNPASVLGSVSTATIVVANTVPLGTYSLTVAGTSSAAPRHAADITLTVIEEPQWHPVAEPLELTVARGSTGRVELSIEPIIEIPGWASYSLLNPPAGVYADFEYHYDWGYPATATIFVLPSAAPGTYPLTVAAAFPGTSVKTVTISLTVR